MSSTVAHTLRQRPWIVALTEAMVPLLAYENLAKVLITRGATPAIGQLPDVGRPIVWQGLTVLTPRICGTEDPGAASVASRLTQSVWPHHKSACMVYNIRWHIVLPGGLTNCRGFPNIAEQYHANSQFNKPVVV